MDYEVLRLKNDRFDMPYLKIPGGKKTLVVLPGMSLRPISIAPEGFASAFSSFCDEYTIYLFDRKENMEDDYSIQDRADDIVEACKILDLKDIYLYGASMGAFMCAHIGFKYPKLAKKIVHASGCYYLNETSEAFMDNVIKYCDEKNVRSLVSYSARMIYSKEFNEANRDSLIKAFSDLNDYEIKQYKADAIAFKKEGYLLNDLEKIEAQTLIVVSKKDVIFGYEPSLIMSLKIKNCECVVYDDYSHAVYDEAPDFRDRMKKFFDN